MTKPAKCSFSAKPHYRSKRECEDAHPGVKATRCARCRMWEPQEKQTRGRRR